MPIERVRACPVSELDEISARRIEGNGVAVCVALADGRPVAVADRCAHREIALSGGLVRDGVLTCPGHFWRYDLRTGHCLHQPETVPTYACTVEDGWVVVDVPSPPPAMSVREMLVAHARRDLPA